MTTEAARDKRDAAGSKVSVVVPVFNEEEVIGAFHERTSGVMRSLGCDYEIMFVDDGSRDGSLLAIRDLAERDPHVSYVSFTRNFGHESATSAGLDFAAGDAVVIIDGDLQDPPEVISEMFERWLEGNEIVYGRRRARAAEPALKRASSFMFYRIMRRISRVDIPLDTGDFRLMDRLMVDFFRELKIKNRFVRGEIAWLGGRTSEVLYNRDPRYTGKSKYNALKRLNLSMHSIMSFSTMPLTIMSFIGLTIFALSMIAAVVVAVQKIFFGIAIQGYAFLVISLLFLSGFQMLFFSLVGAYLSRMYSEVQARPLYLVSSAKRAGMSREEAPRGRA